MPSEDHFYSEISPGNVARQDRDLYKQSLEQVNAHTHLLQHYALESSDAQRATSAAIREGESISIQHWADLITAHTKLKQALEELIVEEMAHLVRHHNVSMRKVSEYAGMPPATGNRILRERLGRTGPAM